MTALRRLVAAVFIGLAAALACGVTAAPAWAHDELLSTSPASGSTVTKAPHQVTLTFNEAIQPVGDALVVTAPDGSRVDTGVATPNGATLTTKLTPLTQNGTYTTTWRVVSADGHPVSGTFTFTLAVAGDGSSATPVIPTPGASPALPSGNGRSGQGALIALGVVLVVGGGTYALMSWARANRRRDRT